MAKEYKAIKYRIYPNEAQKELFAKTFGCCRKIYNLMLFTKIQYYKETKQNISVTPAMYNDMFPYLKEVDSLALSNEKLHLQTAFNNFFRDVRIGFPKYKSKHRDKNSYTTNKVHNNIEIMQNSIKLPKVGKVKARIHRNAPDGYKLKSVTVSMERDGSYFASVLYEYESNIKPVEYVTTHIGLDYSSSSLYVDSNGNSADMPHYYRKSEKKLAKLQRKFSRKQTNSNNKNKARRKIAKLSKHVANQRKDFLHKKSNEITNQYDLISVETLNIKAISQSLKLGKATLDNGYGLFLIMLEYKQKQKGHYLMKVDKKYPSSQLCNTCGYKNSITKNLAIHTVTCPVCRTVYNRDVNAAKNIDQEGLRLLTA